MASVPKCARCSNGLPREGVTSVRRRSQAGAPKANLGLGSPPHSGLTRHCTSRDVDLVDAMLKAPSLARGVPDPGQRVDLGEFAYSEAAPVIRRTVRREHFVARSAELIREDVWITRLGAE